MTVTESLPALEAVRRELEIDEQAPGGHPQVRAVLTLTTTLDLAPARLWPLLTRPAELAAWYGPVEGDLAEGGGCTAPDGVRGRVLEVEEPHRLTLVREQDGAESLFVLRLDPEDDGTTQLSLRHTVLVTRERFDAGGIGEIALGWELALLALAARTDGWRSACPTAAPAPTPGWRHGEEGRRYLRAWSVRWTAAALAAGMDEVAARRAEAETLRTVLSP
jgi:uncharacterized protein YndB with AHSA1/START domain